MSWLDKRQNAQPYKHVDKKAFIEWLNKAGQSWKDFWDTPVTIQYAYNPHAVVGNGGTPFSTTQRRGDFATQTAAAIAIPATAAGVATMGVVPTLVGMGAGIGVGTAADAGGTKLVELAGGDENAQEMVGDIAGFIAGAVAGGKATKATTNYLNFWNSWLDPKNVYTAMAEGMAPTTTSNKGIMLFPKRQSKVSAQELVGTPKVIRNQPAARRMLLGEGPYDELANKGIFGALIGEGSESVVYQHASDPTKVLKVNTDINGRVNKGRHAAIKRYIDQRNSLGIQKPIKLEGVVLDNGQYRPVFSQEKVNAFNDRLKDYALWREYEENVLAPFLEKQGFKWISEGIYDKVVDGTSYRFSDIAPYNIGIGTDGNPILFDADVVRTDLLTGKKFKSGGPIKIKKKNLGSFTRYCNGKVTEECIRKGKNSSNPTTRKRATFAQNARRWKHQDGGIINYLSMFNENN